MRFVFVLFIVGALGMAAPVGGAAAQDLPVYLQDRGEGVTTSLFGTYVRGGELLFYPFYEYYSYSDEPYTGADLGVSTNTVPYAGKLHIHEGLLFLAYGLTEDFAIEIESKFWERAELDRASADTTSGLPSGGYSESMSFGGLQGQLRWRFARETATSPEMYTWVEIDHPLADEKRFVGSAGWEGALGVGIVKGFSWGTITPRISLGYESTDKSFVVGEWAVEYLKRLSEGIRLVATVEGNGAKNVALVGEL